MLESFLFAVYRAIWTICVATATTVIVLTLLNWLGYVEVIIRIE